MNDKLSRALENDQLNQYLTGEGEYYFHPEMADLPTDPLVAFHFIEQAFEEKSDLLDHVWKAIGTMSSDEAFSWFSLYYLLAILNYLRARKINKKADELVNLIQANLVEHRSALMNNRSYEGRQWVDGLWGDVVRLARIMESDFGVSFSKITSGPLL